MHITNLLYTHTPAEEEFERHKRKAGGGGEKEWRSIGK
jgi:hypothetical protein